MNGLVHEYYLVFMQIEKQKVPKWNGFDETS
jgi:hypothetical protein